MIKIKQECTLGRFIWTLLRVCTYLLCVFQVENGEA